VMTLTSIFVLAVLACLCLAQIAKFVRPETDEHPTWVRIMRIVFTSLYVLWAVAIVRGEAWPA
jgi:hypothetical protein